MTANLSKAKEEMKHLLQIVINHQTNSSNVYNPPEELVHLLLHLDQIATEWKLYMKQAKKPSSMDELMKTNKELVMILVDYLSDPVPLKMLLTMTIPPLRNPKLQSFLTKAIQDYQGNCLDYITSKNESVLEHLTMESIREAMKVDRTISKDEESKLSTQEIENYLRYLNKPKSFTIPLSRALLAFQWNCIDSKLEEKVVETFLLSTNAAHISTVLFHKIKRELDFYSFSLHRILEEKEGTMIKTSCSTVGNTLNMENELFEKIKRCIISINKTQKQEQKDALKALAFSTPSQHKKKTLGQKKASQTTKLSPKRVSCECDNHTDLNSTEKIVMEGNSSTLHNKTPKEKASNVDITTLSILRSSTHIKKDNNDEESDNEEPSKEERKKEENNLDGEKQEWDEDNSARQTLDEDGDVFMREETNNVQELRGHIVKISEIPISRNINNSNNVILISILDELKIVADKIDASEKYHLEEMKKMKKIHENSEKNHLEVMEELKNNHAEELENVKNSHLEERNQIMAMIKELKEELLTALKTKCNCACLGCFDHHNE